MTYMYLYMSRGSPGARGTRHGSGQEAGTGGDRDEDEDGDEDEDADENVDGDRMRMGMVDRLSHAGPVVGGYPRYIPGRHALCNGGSGSGRRSRSHWTN